MCFILQVSQSSQLPATKSTVSVASSSTGTYFMDEFNKTMPCFTKYCPENCESDEINFTFYQPWNQSRDC